ncbi:MAG: cellulose binding domain-containing protein, partial [Micromonosporaceae bacterium]|nr:cellulose binding domain-containing protein [Micromonosporaceae bacterium]
VTGNATHFFGLGGPYGGCGTTEAQLESLDYIALNVYNAPNDHVYYQRPMPEGDPKIGMYDNGHNCGRWVQVTIGDFCTGTNDGDITQPFCRGGEWVADEFNGATLKMLVEDSCGDDNAWCRNDPYHIDLHDQSLDQFAKDGKLVGNLLPDHWNNRHVSWEFIPAPAYSGDIKIGFMQGAETWWAAASFSHLANGIHGVESWSGGQWVDSTMNGDMGQSFVLKPYEPGGTRFSVRVRDVNDEYVNDGRVYTFDLPDNCEPRCTVPYQQVDYTTSTAPPTPGASSSAGTSTGTCSASFKAKDSWPSGYQAEITVTAGSEKIRGWRVSWTLGDDQSVRSFFNGVMTADGSTMTVRNETWNGTLAAGASTTFGYVIDGGDAPPASLSCVAE